MPSTDRDPRSKKLRVRWRDPDGSRHTKHVATAADAKRLTREIEEDHSLGRPWQPRVARAVPLLGDAMSAYITDRSRVLSPGTLVRYARTLDVFKRFINDDGATLSTLTKQRLADFFAWLRVPAHGLHGRQRSEDTARKNVEVVQLLWSWCAEHDEYAEHVGSARTIEMKRSQPAITVAPTWAEMTACIDACSGWHRQLATVLYATGLRCNQAMRLRWSDVDLVTGALTIRPELGKSESESRGRIVPLPAWFIAELAQWPRGEYLVTSGRTGDRERQARDRDMARAWTRAGVRAAAWEGRPHHAFRKGYVSGLKRAGADDEAVEFLVGHSLGLRGVYTDADALPLVAAVALVPSLATARGAL